MIKERAAKFNFRGILAALLVMGIAGCGDSVRKKARSSPAVADTEAVPGELDAVTTSNPDIDGSGSGDRGDTPSAGDDAPDGATPDPATPPPIVYQGFGDQILVNGTPSPDDPAGMDRQRIKPFAALVSGFRRVFTRAPASLTANASTFGAVPDRWYEEPKMTGVSILTTYDAAFEAARRYTADAQKWNQAPDRNSARAECSAFAEHSWMRPATDEELNLCITMAVESTSEENDNRLRWAHTLATLLTATGFISY